MSDCLFCKIVSGAIPSTKVHDGEKVIGFKDLRPQAAKHFLFIHKDHSTDVSDMMNTAPSQVQDIYLAIAQFVEKEGLTKEGYRVVTNQGSHAGQTVFHTHFHVLGGEPLGHFGS